MDIEENNQSTKKVEEEKKEKEDELVDFELEENIYSYMLFLLAMKEENFKNFFI